MREQRTALRYVHLTFASDGRHSLFPSETTRREAVHLLARRVNDALVMFSIADDHLHLVTAGTALRIANVRRSLWPSLQGLAACPVRAGYPKEVTTRAHMVWLVEYFLRQVRKHALGVHPALWSGSCFQDLIGARAVPKMCLQFSRVLPRWTAAQLCRVVGIGPDAAQPATDAEVRAAGPEAVVDAAYAVVAAGPEVTGRTQVKAVARRVAVQLAHQVGMGSAEVAWALRIHHGTPSHMMSPRLDPQLMDAVRRQVRLKQSLAWGRAGRERFVRPGTCG